MVDIPREAGPFRVRPLNYLSLKSFRVLIRLDPNEVRCCGSA